MGQRKLTFADHQKSDIKFPVCVLADNLSLKENIGSLFRLCDALAVERLYLSCPDNTLLDNKISKVARNTEKNVPHSIINAPLETLAQLKQDDFTIISLELTTQSIKIQDFDFGATKKICLILGNESKGVSDELLEASDYCIHIPMLGINSSMNVISAASIAVFEICQHLS